MNTASDHFSVPRWKLKDYLKNNETAKCIMGWKCFPSLDQEDPCRRKAHLAH